METEQSFWITAKNFFSLAPKTPISSVAAITEVLLVDLGLADLLRRSLCATERYADSGERREEAPQHCEDCERGRDISVRVWLLEHAMMTSLEVPVEALDEISSTRITYE
ncbi:hypothetical protein TELCIR_01580 [Teladorsagia circumcincta]|uniref:Uncharacterized protein n=1 Tax=Teladorsagia circumcincta TaxID=45464 RepID=A0A2G9V1H8_TELCI|nr:hypothetical protein TELCIR_01580 [Teladorsagia circumcincta]